MTSKVKQHIRSSSVRPKTEPKAEQVNEVDYNDPTIPNFAYLMTRKSLKFIVVLDDIDVIASELCTERRVMFNWFDGDFKGNIVYEYFQQMIPQHKNLYYSIDGKWVVFPKDQKIADSLKEERVNLFVF